uniref:N(4)-(beta-N-acetylglucosaminyl)-L-asparaginase n=1 Tax=Strigamia maritima TaxID=126957 RepID=T1JK50_STRMM
TDVVSRSKSNIYINSSAQSTTIHYLFAATQFAVSMGFRVESLSTNASIQKWQTWREERCQPNYWQNVSPDPGTQCGPYHPKISPKALHHFRHQYEDDQKVLLSHDTIGMVAIDTDGRIAAGTSTNGLIHKIPGRVGDSPIIGSGAYCDKDVGAAAGTGDGDTMMRFLPSYQSVENMRNGMSPIEASEEALKRIISYHANFTGAVIALNIKGEYGAACYGIDSFPYIVSGNEISGDQIIVHTKCLP